MRIRKVSWLVFVLISMAAAGLVLALDAVRDDAGDTLRQVTEGEGNPGPLTFDATNRLWVHGAGDSANTRGIAVVIIAKDTWTALSGIGTQRYLLLNCRSITSANTATINVWCSDDSGATWFKAVRADTLAPALAVSVACGTAVPGTPGGTTYYVDTLVLAVGPATHIYIEEDAVGTDNFVYEAGGL